MWPIFTTRCDRYCIETATHRITKTTQNDSPGTLVLWRQKSFQSSNGVTPNGGDKCRWGGVKSANFCQWTISGSDALPPQMCVHPPGRRCYCYQQHPLEVTHDDNVCNANDIGLKAHSHRDDINEVSRQFIAVLVCQYNSLQSRRCEWTLT